ncbi:hypothetical protein [Clostridium tagluense]|uniref:Uncharacterized protein n=1 Tax=Clostridium tagluense TaxID=360422 RepID=A0A401UST7_9CLOT|nr:hypothetical protein [Clostridium tagluense]GCD12622.1 hypothetical protein Ctaglu_42450 [Clostridium tagluense]
MESDFIEIWSNGISDIVIWELDYTDGQYMAIEDTDCRFKINDKTRHRLEGYKKTETPRLVDKDKILNMYVVYYLKNGHFLSGSISFSDLKWKFPDVNDIVLSNMLYELVKDGKLSYKNTIGGASYYLKGKTRTDLIEKNNLIPKWKEIVNGRASWMHDYEHEYECAKKDIRTHNE